MFKALVTIFVPLLFLCGSSVARAQTESPHVKGPYGLEAWTVYYPHYEKSKIAGTLKIARNGKVIAIFKGAPFIWRWIFLENGTQIAFESGPLHFGMACILADLSTAKEVERVDCFNYPDNSPQGVWPSWINILENSQ